MTLQHRFDELTRRSRKQLELAASGDLAGESSIDQLQTWLDPMLVEVPRIPLRVWHSIALVVISSALLWWAILYAAYWLLQ